MTMRFTDKASVGAVKQTAEGYLVATSRVARTGVQVYLAMELGDIAKAAGFEPNDHVRVYRAPDQVFAADSLATITRLPITIDHPAENVTAENWADLAVGEVGDAYTKDGDWVIVNPMLKDAKGVQAAKTTHKEFSLGYSADIIKARDGVDADFEISQIRYNHLALVPQARAGKEARIGDGWGASPIKDFQPSVKLNNQGGRMPDLKTVVLGDKAVQVADTDVAAIESYKADMQRKLSDAETSAKSLADSKDEEIGALKAELKTAKDAAAAIDIDALVSARAALVEIIKELDETIDVEGKADDDLRKEAVASKLGADMVADASPAVILGMFKAIAKDSGKNVNPAAAVIKHGVKNVGDAAAAEKAAWQKSIADANAWRNK